MHSDPRAEVLDLCHRIGLTSEPDDGRIIIRNRSASFRRAFRDWPNARSYLTRQIRTWDEGGDCPRFFLP